MPTQTRARLDTLTGLRFGAAFVVFASHAASWFTPAVTNVLAPFTHQGRAGVSFFFILSGFVLTWSTSERHGPRSFYRARFARIWPSFFVCWVGVAAINLVGDNPTGVAQFFLGAFLLQNWVPDADWYFAYNGVSWSLSCEAFFYALYPLLVLWLSRASRGSRLGILAVALTIPFVVAGIAQSSHIGNDYFRATNTLGIWAVNYFPLSRLPEFVVGVILALEAKAGRGFDIGWKPALGLATLAYVASGIWQSMFSAVAITFVPFALLIAAGAAVDNTGQSTLFSRRLAVWLGDISFCFYLVHVEIVGIFGDKISNNVLTLVPGALLVSVGLAAGLHYLVERPFNKWLKGASNVLVDDHKSRRAH